MPIIVGLDFDNTLVDYDSVFYAVAQSRGLLSQSSRNRKFQIRESVRRLPDGEIQWQKLQAAVYGPRIAEAKLIDGVHNFVRSCRERKIPVYVVSHKTEKAAYGDTDTNLRSAAINWMGSHKFFEPDGLGFQIKDVFFESTRLEKLERIGKLKCTHFIDDLEETFSEDSFPNDVVKILYSPLPVESPPSGLKVAATWADVSNFVFEEST